MLLFIRAKKYIAHHAYECNVKGRRQVNLNICKNCGIQGCRKKQGNKTGMT